MNNNTRINMTEGDISTTLRKLTIPMILGIIALVAFNLAELQLVPF